MRLILTSTFLMAAMAYLPSIAPVLAQDDANGGATNQPDGATVTIPEVTGTFRIYPSQRPHDASRLDEWLASGKVLKAGWQGKIGKNEHLAFAGKPYERGAAASTQDADLEKLKGLTALHSLSLFRCYKITDVGLTQLKGLTALRSLDLTDCKLITADAVAALKKSLPELEVER